jgi:hypothetical protein
MYSLGNIVFSDYNIQPSLVDGSTIALSGFLDMPKRLGKTHHVWHEAGVEPYVSASEIRFAGRNITFKGILNVGTKENVIANLTSFYNAINALTDLVDFKTPYGTFKGLLKQEIPVKYFDNGVAEITMVFRQPKVFVPANFVSPLFVSSEFIETVCNPIIDDYENSKQTIFNNFVSTDFIAEGFIEQLPPPTREYYNIDGFKFTDLGFFVQKVADNFNRAAVQDENVVIDNLEEHYQLKNPAEKKLRLQLLAIAPTITELKQNTNALFVLLAKPETRKIQVDTRFLDAFAVDGFEVKNIGLYNGTCVATIELELIII